MKHSFICAGLFILVLFGACSKKAADKQATGPGLPGSILYEFAGDVYQVDLQTGTRTVFFSYNTYSFNGWDLSRDLQYGLTSEREPGNYETATFKLLNANDRQIIKQFEYAAPNSNGQKYSGTLSHDNSFILIQPDSRNGIVIMDTNGELNYHLEGINGEPITLGDKAIWLPDNSLLFTFKDRFILRTAPPYTALSLVKEMNYEQWGNLRTNSDGSRISMFIGNHIHLMDIDGNNLQQVTESESAENMAVCSPDGNHLVVGCDYVHAPNSGSVWKLKIIPNDGKLYNLDHDPSVIPLKPANERIEASVSGKVLWIP